ncbi:MAG: aspartate-semialdehyde dehydrogenase [Planctomycetes bacterium]|nr:aspartate-semialdehyde dehydrogenase [Planctomycetota bacterium]
MTPSFAPGLESKIPVGLLGATGSVGQRFVQLLADHPWFELVWMAASDRRAGKSYGSQVDWAPKTIVPTIHAHMELSKSLDADRARTPLVFSALPASEAGPVESELCARGIVVVSNASSHRMDADVPLLVPEVNADHLALAGERRLFTGPNCCVAGLVLALAPIQRAFGIRRLFVATMQALSGAGLPGAAGPLAEANVLPHIPGEIGKIESEPFKILASLKDGSLTPPDFKISAQCNRVAVLDGHTMSVSMELESPASSDQLIDVWNEFRGEPQALELPSAPTQPVRYHHGDTAPNPREYAALDGGMTTHIGQLAECAVLGHKFTLSTHNTLRGAAAGNVLIAELLAAKGMLA